MQRLPLVIAALLSLFLPPACGRRRLEAGRRAADDALGEGRLAGQTPCRNTRGRKWSARTG